MTIFLKASWARNNYKLSVLPCRRSCSNQWSSLAWSWLFEKSKVNTIFPPSVWQNRALLLHFFILVRALYSCINSTSQYVGLPITFLPCDSVCWLWHFYFQLIYVFWVPYLPVILLHKCIKSQCISNCPNYIRILLLSAYSYSLIGGSIYQSWLYFEYIIQIIYFRVNQFISFSPVSK